MSSKKVKLETLSDSQITINTFDDGSTFDENRSYAIQSTTPISSYKSNRDIIRNSLSLYCSKTNILNVNEEYERSDDCLSFLNYNDQRSTENENLNDEIIENCLSNIGRCPDGYNFALIDCRLCSKNLINIKRLSNYPYIQFLDIQCNSISDISCLSYLKHLTYVNASKNDIANVNFENPIALRYLNLSFNELTNIGNIPQNIFLDELYLEHNEINNLDNINQCGVLKVLNLAHNNLVSLDGLENIPVGILNLNCDLSGNEIQTLIGLSNHRYLEILKLENNKIVDIYEIEYLKYCFNLRNLNLLRNSIQEIPNYRNIIIYQLNFLHILDKETISIYEKIKCDQLFNPTLQETACNNNLINSLYQNSATSVLQDTTLPDENKKYPILAIVGPVFSNKIEIGINVLKKYDDIFMPW
ncbi:hypothetical protein A3Q56_07212 [Intoshia linei]|uniref:Uncharacterized protein n=1 Tax=Intoshia linei TaxID=1819745 RepID=A0A177AV33_9BILA|nr:hypothetical protein A3Q56_07212 [Intoshia linei]